MKEKRKRGISAKKKGSFEKRASVEELLLEKMEEMLGKDSANDLKKRRKCPNVAKKG